MLVLSDRGTVPLFGQPFLIGAPSSTMAPEKQPLWPGIQSPLIRNNTSGLSLGRWPATIPHCFDRATYSAPSQALRRGPAWLREEPSSDRPLGLSPILTITDHGTITPNFLVSKETADCTASSSLCGAISFGLLTCTVRNISLVLLPSKLPRF